MKIVQVCPYSWSARGGVQTHVRQLSRHLSGRGHEVLVLAAGPVGRRAARVEPAAETTGAAGGWPKLRLVGSSMCVPFNGSLAPICLQPTGALAVRQALRQFQPDLVHVHEPFVPGVSMSAVWFARAPVVATFHAYCPSSLDASLYTLAAHCFWPIRRRVAVQLSVSQAAASYAASRVGGAMHVVPNGVDVEAFERECPASLTSKRKLLFVGRLDWRKGFDVAVRAFARLCDRYDDLVLLVVGEGPCHSEIDGVPQAVRRRIVMLGDVEDGRLPSIYAAADVFIAPAIGGESFGMVLLEAMAAGRTIVATDIDGYREVVRADVDALVVRPRDAQGLAASIGRVLEDPALARRLGLSARDRVQQFAWTVVTDAVEHAYRDVVGYENLPARRRERLSPAGRGWAIERSWRRRV
ncbi:MAG: glycosyltransferase family 4 protein [Vicinamibacterales bacterium]